MLSSDDESEGEDNKMDILISDDVLLGSSVSISSFWNSEVSQKELEEENILLKKKNASMENTLQSNSA